MKDYSNLTLHIKINICNRNGIKFPIYAILEWKINIVNQLSSFVNTRVDMRLFKCRKGTKSPRNKKSRLRTITKTNPETTSSENNSHHSHYPELVEFPTSSLPNPTLPKKRHSYLSHPWSSKALQPVSSPQRNRPTHL